MIGTGGAMFLGKKDSRVEAARGAYYLAQKTYTDEIKAMVTAEIPVIKPEEKAKKPKDSKVKQADAKKPVDPQEVLNAVLHRKFDVDAKLPGAVAKYTAVANEYPGTLSGHEATLALGDLYFSHGEPAKAISWFEKASHSAKSLFDRSLAFSSLGYAYEASGKPTQAIGSFENALNQGELTVKGDLLLAIARCRESLKDYSNAKTTYDTIVTQLPGTDYAKKAELFKSQLE